MRRSLLVLLLAVLLPSLILGGLALRGAREQQIILERRTAELYQKEAETVAAAARAVVSDERREFAEAVRQLLAEQEPAKLAPQFSAALARKWNRPAVGFAIDRQGRLLSPSPTDASRRPEWQQFLRDNSAFLGNKAPAQVYPVQLDELSASNVGPRNRAAPPQQTFQKEAYEKQQAFRKVVPQSAYPNLKVGGQNLQLSKPGSFEEEQQARVEQKQAADNLESQLAWSNAEFRDLTTKEDKGVVNRFVGDRLNMIFWSRPAGAKEYLFGCLLRAEGLQQQFQKLYFAAEEPETILALLDDKARPVAMWPAGSKVADWKRPFVASEIGEALPHWEAAFYLRNPEQIAASAQQVRRNLYLLISFALLAIAMGGWVVFADTRRQLALAQKKTDFVSNVSHELKTPLTSIRMFAEMMHDGRAEPARQPQYLRIIMVEAERLTRLINNVLDFARLERKQRRFEKRRFDLHKTVADLWASQEVHLQEAGFTTKWEAAPAPYEVLGDEDALAQALVNLLSNAEKYGGERKEITLHTFLENAHVCLSVLDRGAGVPAGEEAKIFEPFYRAHDSLSSGIPGTGLGLALARRVVAEHGGEILYQQRPGGGSNFTIRLPLAGQATRELRGTDE